jgi:hypothetical protein
MRVSQSSCSLLLGGGFVLMIGNLLYAACADSKPRANSPCITQRKICTSGPNCTSSTEEVVGKGNFQCDDPASGKRCQASGPEAPCREEWSCKAVGSNANCLLNQALQSYTALQLVVQDCPM